VRNLRQAHVAAVGHHGANLTRKDANMMEHNPQFPPEWQALVAQVGASLRALALDESAKARFCTDPMLSAYLEKVARRYVAGNTVYSALKRVAQIVARGHLASAEYMGESCHDEGLAMAETDIFLDLIRGLDAQALPSTISLDLSHIGALVDPELGYRNACAIASAAAAGGRELMISMENVERSELIYTIYRRLHDQGGWSNVGITVPARRHRSAADLVSLLPYPGRIRLVKGAFHEPESVGHARGSPALREAFVLHATQLLRSKHLCSIATHDHAIQRALCALIGREDIARKHYEFECLDGLGTAQLGALHAAGFPTREYMVFGSESFLYVLNRISEEPVRVYQAIVDLLSEDDAEAVAA
jgi:proline dehydrogenase